MSIVKIKRKNKGTTYRVKIIRSGKFFSRTFGRLYDAEEFEEKIKLSEGNFYESRITFEDMSIEWLDGHAIVKKARSSVATDRQMLRSELLPAFGKKILSEIKPTMIEQLIHRLMKKDLKSTTINRYLELTRTIFNYAIKRQKASFNPVSAVGLLKTQLPPFSFWTQGEAQQFLNYVSKKYQEGREIIPFLYACALNLGLRMGELIALSWLDVDLENRLITIRRSYCNAQHCIKETTKSRKIRYVPINSALYSEFVRMKAQRQCELVFSTNGRPMDRFNLVHNFQRDSKEAGVRRIRFHDLRHTFASHWIMNSSDIYSLKAILGHSNIGTTERYAHLSKSFLVDKADAVHFSPDGNIVHVELKRAVADGLLEESGAKSGAKLVEEKTKGLASLPTPLFH